MKLGALLLGAGAAVIAASVFVPPNMEREDVQRVPLSPVESNAPTTAQEDHEVAPSQPSTGAATTTTPPDERRRRGSSTVDVEPQGSGFAEGQNANGSEETPDPDDDCHHDDEDFPFCDGDRPGDD